MWLPTGRAGNSRATYTRDIFQLNIWNGEDPSRDQVGCLVTV